MCSLAAAAESRRCRRSPGQIGSHRSEHVFMLTFETLGSAGLLLVRRERARNEWPLGEMVRFAAARLLAMNDIDYASAWEVCPRAVGSEHPFGNTTMGAHRVVSV